MFLDAAGHDANCAFAGDPRAKCTCGGKKAKAPYKPLNLPVANDSSGIAAMAGDLPHQDMIAVKAKTLTQQVMMNKEEIITTVTSEVFADAVRSKLTAKRYPDGREIYAYEGKDFLETFPVEFNSVRDGDSYKITAVQRWRKLEI